MTFLFLFAWWAVVGGISRNDFTWRNIKKSLHVLVPAALSFCYSYQCISTFLTKNSFVHYLIKVKFTKIHTRLKPKDRRDV